VDAQCDKLAMVVGRQFITLSVHLCVQHDVWEAAHRTGLSARAETCKCKLQTNSDGHILIMIWFKVRLNHIW